MKPPFGSARELNGVVKGRLTLDTADPLAQVKEFYENRLKSDGFDISADKSKPGLFEKAELTASKESWKQWLHVSIVQMKARTVVTLTYENVE